MFQPDGDALPRGRIYVSWYDSVVDLRAGERWQLKVRLKRVRGLGNPGAFDAERWAFTSGIHATAYIKDSALNQRLAPSSDVCRLTRWRSAVASRIEAALDGERSLPFLLALAVGARHRLSADDWSLLRRTGTVHLMAISGLHVGLVAGWFFFIGNGLARLALAMNIACSPRFVGQFAGGLAAVAYSALAGFGVPTVRALIMVLITILAVSVRRRLSVWGCYALTLVVILMVDPTATLGSGFWLSFGGVGILLLHAAGVATARSAGFRDRLRKRGAVLATAQIKLSVGLAPLLLLMFEQVAWLAPLANFLVVPVFALVVVPLTLSGAALLLLAPGLGALLLRCAGKVTGTLLDLLGWLDGALDPVWVPPFVNLPMLLAAGLAALLLLWPAPLSGRWIVLALLAPVLTGVPQVSMPAGEFRLMVMDVGQGLAALVQTRNHALLYDAGPGFRGTDAGSRVVIPALRAVGGVRPDVLLVSHGDLDHRGGAGSVLEEYPDAIVIAPERFDLPAKHFITCRSGISWNWDGVQFRLIHPPGNQVGPAQSDNDGSCVLLVETPFSRLLLPGDIEQNAEAGLVRQGLLSPVDIVVAPHHGSKTSSSEAFVRVLQPRYVIFSAAWNNRWGFPAQEVSQRWRQAGACLLVTGDAGAVMFDTDKAHRLRLRWSHREENRRFWSLFPARPAMCQE